MSVVYRLTLESIHFRRQFMCITSHEPLHLQGAINGSYGASYSHRHILHEPLRAYYGTMWVPVLS